MSETNSVIPLNDLKRSVSKADGAVDAAVEALRSGWWLNGRETSAFCEAFGAYIGVSHCLGVANGTDALEIAMRALAAERRRGGADEVVTVANAGGYSTIAARLAGLTPAYADIERGSQLVHLPSMVSLVGERTAMVVVTHLYGGVVDVAALRSLLDAAGFGDVPILEDCAQSHGAAIGPRKAGSLGDVATFSFYPTKNLGAFGDGGAIATSRDDLDRRCRQLAQYGWSSKYNVEIPEGRNSRLDEVQAAILRQGLAGLDEANRRRVSILQRYEAAVPAGVTLVRSPNGTVGHLAVVLSAERDALREHLTSRKIQSEIHYPILDCDHEGLRGLPQRMDGDLTVSRQSVREILTLPCFPTMTDDEVSRVCEALRAWGEAS